MTRSYSIHVNFFIALYMKHDISLHINNWRQLWLTVFIDSWITRMKKNDIMREKIENKSRLIQFKCVEINRCHVLWTGRKEWNKFSEIQSSFCSIFIIQLPGSNIMFHFRSECIKWRLLTQHQMPQFIFLYPLFFTRYLICINWNIISQRN